MTGVGWDVVFATAGAVIASLASNWIARTLATRRAVDELRLKVTGSGVQVDVPAVTSNWRQLEKSIGALGVLAPDLAIIDGWRFVDSAIRNRAKALGVDAGDLDALSLAKQLHVLSDNTMQRLSSLNHFRNYLSHTQPKDRREDPDMSRAATSILPLIREIGSPWVISAGKPDGAPKVSPT